MYPRRQKDAEGKHPPGCLERNTRFVSSVGTIKLEQTLDAQLFLTNVNSSYLHFNDSLESLRLCWLRLKLAPSVQFLGRNTIEISLTVHPSVTP